MSNNETAALPLQALYELHTAAPAGREGMPAFAAELAKRLAQGCDAEVADFLRDSSSLCQERLHQLPGEHAPWQRDHALWLALARISLPLGQFYGGNSGVPRRSAELTAELTALARAWLDDWGSRTHQPWRLRDGYDLVLRQVFGVLGHEGMSSAEITGLLRWARELSAKAGIAPGAQYYCHWQHLLHQLPEPELLAMAIEDGGGQLSRDIVQRQLPLQRTRPAAQRWALWREFFAQFPAVLDQLRLPEPVLIASRWETADAARRDLLAQDLFKALCFASDDDWPHDRVLVERMLQTDAAPPGRLVQATGPPGRSIPSWRSGCGKPGGRPCCRCYCRPAQTAASTNPTAPATPRWPRPCWPIALATWPGWPPARSRTCCPRCAWTRCSGCCRNWARPPPAVPPRACVRRWPRPCLPCP